MLNKTSSASRVLSPCSLFHSREWGGGGVVEKRWFRIRVRVRARVRVRVLGRVAYNL